ncbi:AEC family transporter [Burkholderiaceae bacterium FT117]|uniref:AEC family transporter n=1 Tax=Zeimonas sediminis TaxID=2944268 RepID=UPI0023431820|nr:AEC family transporter [Zeimonas sediminis]MCM5570039.1 AEC family transporter [Zeimonas sediminis]
MSVFFEVIFPVVVLIAIGYGAARLGRFPDAAVRALSDATFLIFMPALLFGALARVDFDSLSPGAALAYYGAGLPLFGLVLGVQLWRGEPMNVAVVHGLSGVFSNTAMLGIPLVRLAFGEAGLAFLLTIIALHALTFLTLGTLLIELFGGAGGGSGRRDRGRLAAQTAQVVRNSLIHPVVLPILAGLAWSAAGWKLPRPVDVPLGMLAGAAAPLCLVLLGASLAQFDLRRGFGAAAALTGLKSLVHPLLAYAIGRWLLELPPLPLAVATITASLPIGANVYLFAQRYRAVPEQTSAGVTLSTLVAAASLPLLLFVLPGR